MSELKDIKIDYSAMPLSGSLAMFYPCQLKNTPRIKRLMSMWKRRRKLQIRSLKNGNRPLTDLMDAQWVRDEMDGLLSFSLPRMSNKFGPYATQCLSQHYQKQREGKLHSKEINQIVSRFHISVDYKKNGVETKVLEFTGFLLFSLNFDNRVGTYIVNINFENLSVDEVIFLKHVFYKRFTVNIKELPIEETGQGIVGCRQYRVTQQGKANIQPATYTFPEYVLSHAAFLRTYFKMDIDFRARYSLLEINQSLPDSANYGLIKADEEYLSVPEPVVNKAMSPRKDLSSRIYYSYFVDSQNGLIINNNRKHSVACIYPLENAPRPQYHVENSCKDAKSCIPGVSQGIFKTFLKAIELHYLVNAITTNEIEERENSNVNPIILLHRVYGLWKIISEVDMNPYFTDDRINREFGTKKKMMELRDEYKTTINLILSYAATGIAVATLIFTIAQLWK